MIRRGAPQLTSKCQICESKPIRQTQRTRTRTAVTSGYIGRGSELMWDHHHQQQQHARTRTRTHTTLLLSSGDVCFHIYFVTTITTATTTSTITTAAAAAAATATAIPLRTATGNNKTRFVCCFFVLVCRCHRRHRHRLRLLCPDRPPSLTSCWRRERTPTLGVLPEKRHSTSRDGGNKRVHFCRDFAQLIRSMRALLARPMLCGRSSTPGHFIIFFCFFCFFQFVKRHAADC